MKEQAGIDSLKEKLVKLWFMNLNSILIWW